MNSLLAALFPAGQSIVQGGQDIADEARYAKVYAYSTLALLAFIAYKVSDR